MGDGFLGVDYSYCKPSKHLFPGLAATLSVLKYFPRITFSELIRGRQMFSEGH